MARARRDVFGEAAAEYARGRPDYPDSLFDDLLTYARHPRNVLEVGAGTGKATVPLAARGCTITCLEPDPRMAEQLRLECASQESVTVVVERLETWRPQVHYDALVAAQSWHWVDPAVRWDRAAELIGPGGTLALFGHKYLVEDDGMRRELLGVDLRYGVDAWGLTPHLAGRDSDARDGDAYLASYDDETNGDQRFTHRVTRRYHQSLVYSASRYLDLLASTSAYRMVEETSRRALFSDASRVIAQHGGEVSLRLNTDLYLARRTWDSLAVRSSTTRVTSSPTRWSRDRVLVAAQLTRRIVENDDAPPREPTRP